MTLLEFIIQLLDKIIWPTTLIFLILMLRKPLRALIPFLKRAKLSELEVEFDQQLADAQRTAAKELPKTTPDWRVELIRLAQHMPNAAVLEAWNKVEIKATNLLKSRNQSLPEPSDQPYKALQDLLAEEELLEVKRLKLFDELRQLRNKVAHAKNYKISSEQATSYVSLALQLIDSLQPAASETPV